MSNFVSTLTNKIILGLGISVVILLAVGSGVLTANAQTYTATVETRANSTNNPTLGSVTVGVFYHPGDARAFLGTTDANGRFTFTPITGRSYRFEISKTNYWSRVFALTIPSNTYTSMVIPLRPVVDQPPAANQAPVVFAGLNQAVTLPSTATLAGTVTDDGLPAGGTLTKSWGKISGPTGGTVSFSNNLSLTPIVTFSMAGSYTLRLTASDGTLSSSNDVVIAVTPQSATYTLTTNILSGSGTVTSVPAGISCGTDCQQVYSAGDSVTLTADPDTGYAFVTWLGNCAGPTPTCTLTMDTNKSADPFFAVVAPTNVVPTVTTPTATSITSSSVTLGANVTSLGVPASISSRGICIGTSVNPTTACYVEGGTTTGAFTLTRNNLSPSTLYHYRGFATNSTGTGYSADATFTSVAAPTATPVKVRVRNATTLANLSGVAVRFRQGGNLVPDGQVTTDSTGFTPCTLVPSNVVTTVDLLKTGYTSRLGINITTAAGSSCLHKGIYNLTPNP